MADAADLANALTEAHFKRSIRSGLRSRRRGNASMTLFHAVSTLRREHSSFDLELSGSWHGSVRTGVVVRPGRLPSRRFRR